MQLPAFSSEKDHVPFFKRIFANFPISLLGLMLWGVFKADYIM